MQKLPLSVAIAVLGFGLYGCQTSCGDHEDPVLWADGIVTGTQGSRVYQTTLPADRWLHFPSYRAFRFPHNFGTDKYSITAYVSLNDDQPVSGEPSDEFAIASGNVIVVKSQTEDELVVESDTCENSYYLYLRIAEFE